VPARLKVCVVDDWLPDDYEPPAYWVNDAGPDERALRDDQATVAWGRWRRARAEWGESHGLDRFELADLIPMGGPRWTRSAT